MILFLMLYFFVFNFSSKFVIEQSKDQIFSLVIVIANQFYFAWYHDLLKRLVDTRSTFDFFNP